MKEKLTVIKVGGKIVEEPDTLNQLLDDFSSLSGYRVKQVTFTVKPVFLHDAHKC